MYVERDGDGDIIGAHKWPVVGIAEEEIAEDHADWLVYLGGILLKSKMAEVGIKMHSKLDAGILWAFNQGETPYPVSLNPSMRETLSAFKQLLGAGQTNPHGGYLWSGGVELRKPDGGDLSDAGIDEICMFAGQWALAIARVAIQEKQTCSIMTTPELQAYNASTIDWTVTWDPIAHPDWTDNLVVQNP